MHVGLIVYGLDRPFTGIGRYTVELVRALVGLPDAPQITLLLAGGAGPLADLGLPQITLPGSYRVPGLLTVGSLSLPRIAQQLKLDVIHDLSGMTPFALGSGRAKTVVTIHDVIPWSFPGVSTAWDTLIYRHWLPFIVPRTDGVVTVSECSQRDITRYLGASADHICNTLEGVSGHYHPADLEAMHRVRTAHNLPEHYILYVGSVEERKNLKRVFQAYAQMVANTSLPHKLVIVGPQKWKYAETIDLYQQLNLDERVIFTGYVDFDDLPALYTAADVFVFPSLYEGFGLPVLEAMACGTPVITSSLSSLPEVGGDASLLVDPYNVTAIADAITRVLTDSELRQRMRAEGLAHAACFTWARTAQQTYSFYQHLLK